MKIKKIVKEVFGTEDNILLKFNLSCFFAGSIFYAIAEFFHNDNTMQQAVTFLHISIFYFAIFFIFLGDKTSLQEIIIEFIRLITSLIVLFFSLFFCLYLSINFTGLKLISFSILFSIGVLLCLFYLISKFIDLLKFTKKAIKYLKNKLFDSEKTTTSNIKSLIENITAFLVAIAGMGVAIKAIVEPLLNLIK